MRRHSTRTCGATAFLIICLPLAGCTLVAHVSGRFESPELHIEASRVEWITLSAARLLFELTLCNPNAYAVHQGALRYRLSVNHQPIAEGNAPAGGTVAPGACASIHVPIEAGLSALLNAAPGAMILGEVPYELEVWLAVNSLVRRRDVRFVGSSVLRLNLPLGLARTAPWRAEVAFADARWQT